jgi:hypothetical protein
MALETLSGNSKVVVYNSDVELADKGVRKNHQGATIAEVLALGGGPKVFRARIPVIPEFGTAGPSFIYENAIAAALSTALEFEDFGSPGQYTTTTNLSSILGTDVQKVMVRATDAMPVSSGAGAGISAVYTNNGGTYFIAIDGAAKDAEGVGVVGTSFNLEILLYS